MWETSFCFSILEFFFQDNKWFNPPWGMKFGDLYSCEVLNIRVFYLSICNSFKSWVTPTILISCCFKMLLLGILKLRNTYILPLGWCIYSVQPFIRFRSECLWWDKYLFCFIRICCFFTVRNHDVLLDYMGTPQWGPYGDIWNKKTWI